MNNKTEELQQKFEILKSYYNSNQFELALQKDTQGLSDVMSGHVACAFHRIGLLQDSTANHR